MNTPRSADPAAIGAELAARLRADQAPIPPYPAVALQVQAALQNERTGASELAALVGADAVLSAALLRRVRSAAFKGEGAVTLESAIMKLGSQELIDVILATSLGAAATAGGPLSALRRDLWRRALISARICKVMAPRRGLMPDVAFVAGLLHDFGAVVVVATLEQIARQWELEPRPEGVWRELVEQFHVEFGMVVAARWELPEPIAEVIARHHYPEAAQTRNLAGLIALVDQVIATLENTPGQGLSGLLALPGLDDRDRARIGSAIPEVARQLESLEHALPTTAATVAAFSIVMRSGSKTGGPAGGTSLPPAAGWPVDLALSVGGQAYRVTAVWPDRFAFRGPTATRPNWLADVAFHPGRDEPFQFLANIRDCEQDAIAHDYVSTAQPYALDGSARTAWDRVVAAARQSAT